MLRIGAGVAFHPSRGLRVLLALVVAAVMVVPVPPVGAPAPAAAADPAWTAYVDTYATGSGTADNALSLTPPNGTTCSAPCDPFPSTDTFTLKNYADGSNLTGVQVQVDASVNVVSPTSSGATPGSGDASAAFSGIVNGAGVYSFTSDSGRKFDLDFSGLDSTKTYTITLSANRNQTGTTANAVRWSKFTLSGADAWVNASSSGTQSSGDGSQVWFNTGNNGALGYVAKWTDVTTGADGLFSVQTSYIAAPSGTTDTSSYAPSMVKLEQMSAGPGVPGAPTGVSAVAGDGSAQVSWTAPASDGGSAITDYEVTPRIDGTPQAPLLVGSPATTLDVTGLTNGTAYTFTVAAVNALGTGPASAASPAVTPHPPLDAWTAYADLRSSDGDANAPNVLEITPAGSDPYINPATPFTLLDRTTGYDTDARLQVDNSGIGRSSDNGQNSTAGEALAVFGSGSTRIVDAAGVYTWTSSSGVFQLNFSGLDASKHYTVVLTASRCMPPEDCPSTNRFVDLDLLDVASSTEASGGTTTVYSPTRVGFDADHNETAGNVARWTDIDPGADGDFSVRTNLVDGSGFAPAAVMLQEEAPAGPGVPGAPTGVSAVAGDGSAQVSWTAPASDGGSAITDYEVTPYIGTTAQAPVTVGDVLTTNVTGLTNGTAYTFTVAAVNALGTGPASAASPAVTPHPPLDAWTAYADLRSSDGDANAPNVLEIPEADVDQYGTGSPIDPTATFTLLDFATGLDTDARLQVADSGLYISSDNGSSFTGGPAYDVFGGIVDGAGVYSMQDGAAFQVNVSGLDPAKRYIVVLTSNRNQAPADRSDGAGEDERWTDLELLGADASTEASGGTTTVVVSPTRVRFKSEDNTARGDLVRWTQIDPGADGAFSIAASVYLEGDADRAYAPVQLMLQESDTGIPNTAPDAPALVAPPDDATGVTTAPALDVTVSDPDGDALDATFYGRATVAAAAPEFTIVALPDTQHYSASYPDTFTAQTSWIVTTRTTLNTAFVTHMGDVTDANTTSQWANADAAMQILDAAGVPYGVLPGNHDDATAFSSTFPVSRFSGDDWYGDSMPGKENRDSYQLFSVGDLDFILVDLEYNPGADVRSWASDVLAAHPARRAIVVTHDYLNLSAARSTAGQNIWNDVVGPNCNVFLVLSGHYHPNAEVRLTSQNSCGAPVHQVLQDYQDEANGGNGWLRYYTFKPAENRIDAYTYSPTLDESKTGASSQFSLDYAMDGSGAFASIGTATAVASGGHATLSWPGRAADTEYEWYVKVTDGSHTTTSPTWSFTTGVPGGDEVDPVVSVPADLTVEATGAAGAVVTFSASAVDDVDGSLVPTCAPPSGSTFALGSSSVTCSASDAAGNTGSASFTVTVVDTTAPVISVPADISLPAEGPDGAHVTYSASAVDLVDGSLVPTCAPASGSLFAVGTTTVTCGVSDAAGNAAAPADFAVTVSDVDRAPAAVDGTATTAEDTATPVTLLASDPDGDALTYLVVDGPSHGTLSGTAPALTYTPAPDYAGPDTFTFRASDGTLESNVATWSLTVTPVNDAPACSSGGGSTPEDTALASLVGCSDVDSASLTYAKASDPAHGSLVLAADGGFTYTPAPDYAGPDTFTFRASDGTLESNVATWSLTVVPVNDAPVLAAIGSRAVAELAELSFVASADDVDSAGLTFSLVGAPAGAVIDATSGAFAWTPTEAQGPGIHTFDVRVSDGVLDDVETIGVTVGEVNAAPVLAPVGSRTVAEGATLDVLLTAADEDLPGQALTFAVSGAPYATLVGDTLHLAPAFGDVSGSVTVSVSDGALGDAETISVTVSDVDRAPAAVDGTATTAEDTATPVTLLASDPDGDALTYLVVDGPSHGTLSGTAPALTYTPAPDYAGPDTFTFRASDGTLESNVATWSLTVTPVNDEPPGPPTSVTATAVGSAAQVRWVAPAFDGGSPIIGYAATAQPGGKACTTTGSTSCTITGLADGLYTFAVRATNAAGTGSPSSSSSTLRIDARQPSITPPAMRIAAGGTLGTTTVPILVSWGGADSGSGIERFELGLSTDGGAYVALALTSPTATSFSRAFQPSSSTTYRLRLRAIDRAGNVSSWAYGPTFRVNVMQQSNAAVRYSGRWSNGSSASASEGTYRYTTRANASVSYTFTGRAIAWVAHRQSTLGKAVVYVDGVRRATIDLRASSTAWRRVVFAQTWSTSGTHTIKIVCAGTSGRPRIDVDAFVALR